MALQFGSDSSSWHINAPETSPIALKAPIKVYLVLPKLPHTAESFFHCALLLPSPLVGGQNLYRAAEEGTHRNAGSGCFCVLTLQWVKVSPIRSLPLRLLIPFFPCVLCDSVSAFAPLQVNRLWLEKKVHRTQRGRRGGTKQRSDGG